MVDAADRVLDGQRVARIAQPLRGQVIAVVRAQQAVTGRGDGVDELAIPGGVKGLLFKAAVRFGVAKHLGGVENVLERKGHATLAGGHGPEVLVRLDGGGGIEDRCHRRGAPLKPLAKAPWVLPALTGPLSFRVERLDPT